MLYVLFCKFPLAIASVSFCYLTKVSLDGDGISVQFNLCTEDLVPLLNFLHVFGGSKMPFVSILGVSFTYDQQ